MTYKLKVHIGGQHDFEAEGEKDVVERQFAEFTALVRSVLSKDSAQRGEIPHSLLQFVRTDSESIFLSSLPPTEHPAADAILVLLLAYLLIREVKIVRGGDLLKSLKRSGIGANRIDRALGNYLGGTQALVQKMGIRRGVTYRLTERGQRHAEQIAKGFSDS